MKGLVRFVTAILLSTTLAGPRKGVAPWDTPDAPNPDPSTAAASPLVGIPQGTTQAAGDKATLPNGITVELRSISRRRWHREDFTPILPDSRPTWHPDGSPYLEPESGFRNLGGALIQHPLGGLARAPHEGQEFDDKGARYLTFRLSGPLDADLSLDGYVPETSHRGETRPERHGRDVPLPTFPLPEGWSDYETEIAVDDHAASHYRFAVASGEWKTVASVAIDPAELTGQKTLASGDWGELRQDASAIDRLRKAMKDALDKGRAFGFEGILPSAIVSVASFEPARYATRLRLVDANDRNTTRGGSARESTATLHIAQGTRGRIVVETRPYAWIEFSKVHYDPVPAKWPVAYWGAEGEKAEARDGATALQAIVVPTIADAKMLATHVYAPDGHLWRNHPDPGSIVPYWPDLASYGREANPESKIIASIRLDPTKAVDDNRAWLEGFGSQSDRPGESLGAPLAPTRNFTYRSPVAQYRFTRPTTPYVQIRVRYAQAWKKVGEITPPRAAVQGALANPMRKRPKETASFGIVTVFVRRTGEVGLWTMMPDRQCRKDDGLVKWLYVKGDTLARVVAHLSSGERHVLGETFSSSDDSFGVGFELDGKGELFYQTPEYSSEKKVRLLLKDVAAFEIETQDYGPPVYLVGKVPPPHS